MTEKFDKYNSPPVLTAETWEELVKVTDAALNGTISDDDVWWCVLDHISWEKYLVYHNRWYRRLWRWMRGK